MEPFATIIDLQERWRPLCTPEEISRAGTLLAAASRRIRREYATVDDRIESGELNLDDVIDVVCDMVIRAMAVSADEIGTVSETDTRGPFSHTRRYGAGRGGLYLTDEDRGVFDPDGGRDKAFQINTMPTSVRTCWWV